jgi:hypothetical protein
VTKATPGSFRTRVITDGVIPSLYIDYKGTRIKQYHKEGQALRTETTINNTRDFYIGKSCATCPHCAKSVPGEPAATPNRARHARLHAHRRNLPATQPSLHSRSTTSFGSPLCHCVREFCPKALSNSTKTLCLDTNQSFVSVVLRKDYFA